ncbi:MAG: hypothetical protein ACJ8AW_46820, partial [Rhodopila sp.]
MPDAAKGVRQLVLLHGRDAARDMVEPDAEPLVRIASQVLGDDSGRNGYSYSGVIAHPPPGSIEIIFIKGLSIQAVTWAKLRAGPAFFA